MSFLEEGVVPLGVISVDRFISKALFQEGVMSGDRRSLSGGDIPTVYIVVWFVGRLPCDLLRKSFAYAAHRSGFCDRDAVICGRFFCWILYGRCRLFGDEQRSLREDYRFDAFGVVIFYSWWWACNNVTASAVNGSSESSYHRWLLESITCSKGVETTWI